MPDVLVVEDSQTQAIARFVKESGLNVSVAGGSNAAAGCQLRDRPLSS